MREREAELEQLKMELREVLQSKVDEFQLLGYEQVTADEIWECVASDYVRELPPLHKAVNDIFSLSATKFMNWMMVRMYRGEI